MLSFVVRDQDGKIVSGWPKEEQNSTLLMGFHRAQEMTKYLIRTDDEATGLRVIFDVAKEMTPAAIGFKSYMLAGVRAMGSP